MEDGRYDANQGNIQSLLPLSLRWMLEGGRGGGGWGDPNEWQQYKLYFTSNFIIRANSKLCVSGEVTPLILPACVLKAKNSRPVYRIYHQIKTLLAPTTWQQLEIGRSLSFHWFWLEKAVCFMSQINILSFDNIKKERTTLGRNTFVSEHFSQRLAGSCLACQQKVTHLIQSHHGKERSHWEDFWATPHKVRCSLNFVVVLKQKVKRMAFRWMWGGKYLQPYDS